MSESSEVFEHLMAVIEDRRRNPRPRSYTAQLFGGGVDAIGSKILEEAGEVVEAAGRSPADSADAALVHESADLLYHLFVMLGYREIPLSAVAAELARRFGTSGLDEKAARSRKQDC